VELAIPISWLKPPLNKVNGAQLATIRKPFGIVSGRDFFRRGNFGSCCATHHAKPDFPRIRVNVILTEKAVLPCPLPASVLPNASSLPQGWHAEISQPVASNSASRVLMIKTLHPRKGGSGMAFAGIAVIYGVACLDGAMRRSVTGLLTMTGVR
jgi:hypothetical protein